VQDQAGTRFARNGDVHLAYQVAGDGPVDILFVDTWVHHVEAVWDFPDFARFLRPLASFGRVAMELSTEVASLIPYATRRASGGGPPGVLAGHRSDRG
jgi:hypothetical protein